MLFFDKEKIIVFNDKTIVECERIYVIKDFSYKESNAIKFLIDKLKYKIYNNLNYKYKYENIFLIKSSITQNCSNGKFNIEYNSYFKSKGFEQIIPENYDIVELFNIIYNSKNIIMSWGCCSYLNSVFVNEMSNVLIISNIKYKHEYEKVMNYPCGFYNSGWFPEKCNKKCF